MYVKPRTLGPIRISYWRIHCFHNQCSTRQGRKYDAINKNINLIDKNIHHVKH